MEQAVLFLAKLILDPVWDATQKKFVSKASEQISTVILEQGNNILAKIKSKFPDKAKQLEEAANNSQDVIDAEVIKEIETVANKDDEIKKAIEKLGEMIEANTEAKQVIENWKGINIKGGTTTINNPTLNF